MLRHFAPRNLSSVIHAPRCLDVVDRFRCARGAQCVPLSSETIVRGAGMRESRTPGSLWESRAGNCPRPPERLFCDA